MYDRTGTNFIDPLRMHYYTSKSTLDNLKSVFNVFKGKPIVGARVLCWNGDSVELSGVYEPE